jgi:hypothetical protein
MTGDPGQVRGRVDVVRAAGIPALDERDEIRPGAQERPGSPVTSGRRDHLGPVFTGEQDRIAGLAVVSGDRHAGSAAVRGDQAGDRAGSY